MIEWINPKLWATLAVAALFFVAGVFIYRTGAASVRVQWDAAIIAQQESDKLHEAEIRRLENKRQTQVIEAQNAQTKRIQSLQAAAAGSRNAADGLRNDLAAIAANPATDSSNANAIAISTVAGLLDQCTVAYQRMAQTAQGHYSDSLMYQEAWPK